MRNLVLAFSTVFCVAGLAACDDNPKLNLPDMAMKAQKDLAQLNGCFGLTSCLWGPSFWTQNPLGTDGCPEDPKNPGYLDPTCAQACQDAATQKAAILHDWMGLFSWGSAFCTSGATPPCTAAMVGTATTAPTSNATQACMDCISQAIDDSNNKDGFALEMMNSAAWSTVVDAFTACQNDKP
jgi:hypothetical protein